MEKKQLSPAPSSYSAFTKFSAPLPVFTSDGCYTNISSSPVQSGALSKYSIFDSKATKELNIENVVLNFAESPYKADLLVDRAIGSLLGEAMGDSIGSEKEGAPVNYTLPWEITDFDLSFFTGKRLKAGQYTDDTSMALCLADSLILSKGFDPKDFLIRISLWYFRGYNNGYCLTSGLTQKSHGIGGTSKASISGFVTSKCQLTESMHPGRASNGSIMRLNPVSIYFWDNLEAAIEAADKQSRTTHKAEEASDAAKILAWVLVKALNWEKKAVLGEKSGKEFIDGLKWEEIAGRVKTDNAKALIECKTGWGWKNLSFDFPLSNGFMALDALAMALHCVYLSTSFTEAILMAINIGGDADTVGAICGQIVGALYGVSAIPQKWSKITMQWDNSGEIALRGILLARKGVIA